MSRKPVPRQSLFLLAAAALVLCVSMAVTAGVALILGAMGDELGSRVVGWIALAVAGLLAVDLICLVLALAINSLGESDGPPEGG